MTQQVTERVIKFPSNDELTVMPVEAALGAEIVGIDLTKPIDDDVFETIEKAFDRYSVIFFRNQDLTPEQQIEFTKRFGEIEINPNTQYALDGYPEILLVANVEDKKGEPIGLSDAGRYWHTDMSYTKKPPRCSILHAKEVPMENGKPLGDTMFASAAAAYQALPQTRKDEIDRLRAIHSFAKKRRVPGTKRSKNTLENQKKFPNVIHPVVRVHPNRGHKCLYVTSDECIGLLDEDGSAMPTDDALNLIQYLGEHCTKQEFV